MKVPKTDLESAQVLFDLFEEQLDLPRVLIKLCETHAGSAKLLVRKTDNELVDLGVAVLDAANPLQIVLAKVKSGDHDVCSRISPMALSTPRN